MGREYVFPREGACTGHHEAAPAVEAAEIEALLRRLAEAVDTLSPDTRPRRAMTAEEVAEWWGLERGWVYEHAEELKVRRIGSGSRPRLRFDPDEVAAAMGVPAGPRAPHRGGTRRARGEERFDSLPRRRRANVAKRAVAGRAHAPGPGSDR
jgi:hypothetical protein